MGKGVDVVVVVLFFVFVVLLVLLRILLGMSALVVSRFLLLPPPTLWNSAEEAEDGNPRGSSCLLARGGQWSATTESNALDKGRLAEVEDRQTEKKQIKSSESHDETRPQWRVRRVSRPR